VVGCRIGWIYNRPEETKCAGDKRSDAHRTTEDCNQFCAVHHVICKVKMNKKCIAIVFFRRFLLFFFVFVHHKNVDKIIAIKFIFSIIAQPYSTFEVAKRKVERELALPFPKNDLQALCLRDTVFARASATLMNVVQEMNGEIVKAMHGGPFMSNFLQKAQQAEDVDELCIKINKQIKRIARRAARLRKRRRRRRIRIRIHSNTAINTRKFRSVQQRIQSIVRFIWSKLCFWFRYNVCTGIFVFLQSSL
jgi:hypothetical protein